MKILTRLRPHRPIHVAFAGVLGVVSILGATLSFAGSASATTTAGQTPIFLVNPPPASDNAFAQVPGSAIPTIPVGTASGAAASWAFQLNDQGTNSNSAPFPAATSATWAKGDAIYIPIFEANGTNTVGVQNNTSTGAYVAFAGTPSVVCVGGASTATQPTFSVSTATNPNDNAVTKAAGLKDMLVITFTNSPAVQSPSPFQCAVLGVTYEVGPGWAFNSPGGHVVTDGPAAVLPPAGAQSATSVQGTITGSYDPVDGNVTGIEALAQGGAGWNATIASFIMTANNPPVSVLPNAINAPISNVTGSETFVDQMNAGYICMTASAGGFVISPTSPTFTVSPSNTGGTATINPAVSGLASSVQANGSYQTIEADVLSVSSTVPTTFTLANIHVDAPGSVGPVTVTITVGAAADCTGGLTVVGALQIYAVGQPTSNTRIAGSTSEQTAVASLEAQYPPQPGFCLPQGTNPRPNRFESGSTVVLATSDNWPDALTASYLASYFQTGVLLTPGGSLSPYTAQALQQEGVSNVVIVGGPLAISTAVQNQLASTPAYECGGGVPQRNALGQPIDLNVQRVYGANADATAEAVATYVNSGYVANLNISAAFGKYNDTLGTDSGSSPTISVRTAILVTDNSFQDAASASAMSYYEHLPILLTPQGSLGTQAETGLLDLGIQQVIELGGPLAISNSVNASLASQGISVLRIAGADGSETSVMLAKFELNRLANQGLGWGTRNCVAQPNNTYFTGCTTRVALIRGDYFADALTSSVVTGGGGFGAQFSFRPEPIILAENPTTLGTYATAFFNESGNGYGIDPWPVVAPLTFYPGSGTTISSITVFGGPLAVAQSTLQAALTAISAG